MAPELNWSDVRCYLPVALDNMVETHSSQIFSRLCFAVRHGLKQDGVRLFQQWMDDSDDSQRRDLLLLSAQKDVGILSKLMERHEFVPYQVEEALQVAVRHSNVQVVQVIKQRSLENCLRIQWTAAMLLAAKTGNSIVLAELLEPPFADLEAKDVEDEGQGRTALLWATFNGNVDCVRLLLEAGANPSVCTDLQQSVIHLACERGHSEVLHVLLGLDTQFCLDARDCTDQTPLVLALQARNVECVEMLLKGQNYRVDQLMVPFLMEEVDKMVREDCLDMLEVCLPLQYYSWGQDSYIDKLFSCAIKHQSEKCLKFFLENGANLASMYTSNGEFKSRLPTSTNIKAIFRKFSNCEELLREVFDVSVTVCQEHVEIDFQVLCPENEDKMKVATLLMGHRERTQILQHPVLSTLVHLEWQRWKVFAWYQLIVYLFYMSAMATYVCLQDMEVVSTYVSKLTWVLTLHLLFFAVPNLFPGIPWINRITNITMITIPPLFTMIMVLLPYNSDWASISILLTWLALPFYAYIIPRLNQQIAMFQLVTKDMLKHGILFFYTLLGFSLTFYVLYKDEEDSHFKDFGQAFMFTSVVFLQGGLETSPAFNQLDRSNNTNNMSSGGDDGLNLNKMKHALADLRFSGIVATLLFVFVCILALMNMLIALAVRDSKEMEYFSSIIHQKHMTDWLYEWNIVFKHFVSPVRATVRTIKPGDVPEELYDKLRHIQPRIVNMTHKCSNSHILRYLETIKRFSNSKRTKPTLTSNAAMHGNTAQGKKL